MSEFWDAQIVKCPYCGSKFASCEGPLCDCETERAKEDGYDDDDDEDLSEV